MVRRISSRLYDDRTNAVLSSSYFGLLASAVKFGRSFPDFLLRFALSLKTALTRVVDAHWCAVMRLGAYVPRELFSVLICRHARCTCVSPWSFLSVRACALLPVIDWFGWPSLTLETALLRTASANFQCDSERMEVQGRGAAGTERKESRAEEANQKRTTRTEPNRARTGQGASGSRGAAAAKQAAAKREARRRHPRYVAPGTVPLGGQQHTTHTAQQHSTTTTATYSTTHTHITLRWL